MKTQVHTKQLQHYREGRNIILGVYVIFSTFLIASYALVQYFSMYRKQKKTQLRLCFFLRITQRIAIPINHKIRSQLWKRILLFHSRFYLSYSNYVERHYMSRLIIADLTKNVSLSIK